MASTDDRGFEKTELVMFNPQAPNFQTGVNLVERDTCPNGYQLVDPDKSGKKNQFDLVELAAQVQQADQFTRATAGSKLTVIAEQVGQFISIMFDEVVDWNSFPCSIPNLKVQKLNRLCSWRVESFINHIFCFYKLLVTI